MAAFENNPMLVMVAIGALATLLMLGLAFAGDGGSAKNIRRRLNRVGREKSSAVDRIQEMSARRNGDGKAGLQLVEQALSPFLPRRAVLESRIERTGRRTHDDQSGARQRLADDRDRLDDRR